LELLNKYIENNGKKGLWGVAGVGIDAIIKSKEQVVVGKGGKIVLLFYN
jgi:hypothetical protein